MHVQCIHVSDALKHVYVDAKNVTDFLDPSLVVKEERGLSILCEGYILDTSQVHHDIDPRGGGVILIYH